ISPARSIDVGHRCARRPALRAGHEHDRSDARRRRQGDDGRVEHDGGPRRGLQHALRRIQGQPARVRAHEADSAQHRTDRSGGDGARGRRRHGRQGPGPFHAPFSVGRARRARAGPARPVPSREAGLVDDRAGRKARGIAARAAVSRVERSRISARVSQERAHIRRSLRCVHRSSLRGRRWKALAERGEVMGCSCSRREFLARGLYGISIGAGLPLVLSRTSAALTAQALQGTSVEKHPERILVVIELSGGNDGLNTVVPYGDAAYYRARPKLGIPDREVIRAADGFGFHPSMVGFEHLYKDGMLAVVHGCGYDHPSLSHFSSMGYWHPGGPTGGETRGWLGRLADQRYDASTRNVIVDLGTSQSLAVRSSRHSPLVFDDPARFRREGTDDEKTVLAALSRPAATSNVMLEFLKSTAENATESSDFVRQATAAYSTSVDYGQGGGLGR